MNSSILSLKGWRWSSEELAHTFFTALSQAVGKETTDRREECLKLIKMNQWWINLLRHTLGFCYTRTPATRISPYRTCERGRCAKRRVFSRPVPKDSAAPAGTFPISCPRCCLGLRYAQRRLASDRWHGPRSLRAINGCNKYLRLLTTASPHSAVPRNTTRASTGPTARRSIRGRELRQEPLHLQLRQSHPLHLLLRDFLYKSDDDTSEH